jgi:hypothetical protein
MEKTCKVCGCNKPLGEFERDQRANYRKTCRECRKLYFRKINENRKEYIANHSQSRIHAKRVKLWDYLKTHSCVDCNESDPIVLEFDHIQGEKHAAVSVLISNGASWQKVLDEIEKCVVRCANCHRRKTAIELGWYKTVTPQ